MKLYRIRIRNFRCFKDETSIDFDNLTALIGKNDSGKSTIMEALDIFLNDGVPDKHDASKGGNGEDLTIICEFSDLPNAVIIDEDNPTTLQKELLVNQDGRLEIHKTYSGQLQTPKLTNISACALHPTAENVSDLLQLKNTDLKKRAKDLSIDTKDIDPKVNAQLREKIRLNESDLKLQSSMISLNKDNAKNIWDGLKKYIPTYALFKSDRTSTDQDVEAQDPLKAAIKEAIKSKETELNAIQTYVESEVQKIAQATLEKLREMDSSLASQLTPQFTPPKWDQIFKASITGDENIPINKRGSGVRRLILLNFFRAKAEQLAKESGSSGIIYGFEEPETSQHPNNQKMLLGAFSELSEDYQIILSTHTPVLARNISDSCLRYIEVQEDKSRKIFIGGDETYALFSKTLGVLPDHDVKLFIGVEGPNDENFLKGMTDVLIASGVVVPNLSKLEIDGEIVFIPLGGSTLSVWISRLKKLNRPEFYLYDRDTQPPNLPKSHKEMSAVNARPNCTAISTAKREMENYLHRSAIIAAYSRNGIELTIPANFGDYDDVPIEVAKLVHQQANPVKTWDQLDDDTRDEKESKAKRVLNRQAPSFMNQILLSEVDPAGDLISWLTTIQSMLNS